MKILFGKFVTLLCERRHIRKQEKILKPKPSAPTISPFLEMMMKGDRALKESNVVPPGRRKDHCLVLAADCFQAAARLTRLAPEVSMAVFFWETAVNEVTNPDIRELLAKVASSPREVSITSYREAPTTLIEVAKRFKKESTQDP